MRFNRKLRHRLWRDRMGFRARRAVCRVRGHRWRMKMRDTVCDFCSISYPIGRDGAPYRSIW